MSDFHLLTLASHKIIEKIPCLQVLYAKYVYFKGDWITIDCKINEREILKDREIPMRDFNKAA
jgi:hypothetical protein